MSITQFRRSIVAWATVATVVTGCLACVSAPSAQAQQRFKPGLPAVIGPRSSGPAWRGAAPLPTPATARTKQLADSTAVSLSEPITVTLGQASTAHPVAAAAVPMATPTDVAASIGAGAWRQIGGSGIKVAPAAAALPEQTAPKKTATGQARGKLTVSTLSPDAAVAAGFTRDSLVFKLQTTAGGQPGAVALTVPTLALSALAGGDYASRVRWTQVEPSTSGAQTDATSAKAVGSQLTDGGRTAVVTPSTATAGRTVLLAATAGSPSSATGTGDFGASPIAPSSQWSVSPQTGAFSWQEPLRVPPAAAGPTPNLAFAYSSTTLDGETGSTNNQNSAGIGDGWSLTGGGQITRSYATCALDTPTGVQKTSSAADDTGDQCWRTDNATLTLNGQSNVLVKGADAVWRLSSDDGSRVEHLTGGVTNGTYDNDYWRVTTRAGTQYYFGRNQLPGAAANAPTTNSVSTVPVYGNDANEPCHKSTFAASSCKQAWAWNLDYVVDVHQQSEALYYTQQTDRYTSNSGPQSTGTTGTNPTTVRSYVRADDLTRIDYDMHAGSETTTLAPERAVIDHDIRCMSTDGDGNTFDCTKHANWQDTPFDQDCSSTSCATKTSPSFFSETRLSDVHTQLLSGTTYNEVDRWTLAQTFPAPGDGSTPSLWLRRITHSGSIGGSITLPGITFGGVQLANRIQTSTTTGLAPQIKFRVNLVQNESGGTTGVTYMGAGAAGGCTTTSVTSQAPQSNATRCFPQWWRPPVTNGATYNDPEMDWFVHYPVSTVAVTPTTGGTGAPQDLTSYTYGTPAWRYDTSPLVPDAQRTWSNFAGYDSTRIDHGDPNSPSTQESTQNLYFRGMNGDRASTAGGTKAVTATASDGTAVQDEYWWSGRTLQSTTTNGVGGAVVASTVTVPYGVQTGTDGLNVSEYTDDAKTTTSTALAAGGSRVGVVTYGHDALGRIVTTDDNPDTGNTSLERCTTMSYADNAAAMILSATSETQTVSGTCTSTTPASTPPAGTITDTRLAYDGQAFGVAPTTGDPTTSTALTSLAPSAHWVSIATAYDTLGRPTSVTAPLKPAATTAYTPAASTSAPTGPATSVTVTNAMGWASSTTYDPSWGAPTTETDANNDTTTASYDPLGRITAVWKPNRPQATYPTAPSLKYAYTVSQTQPTTVATSTLDANSAYQTTYALYDGMSRQVQTQSPSEAGGSVVTDTGYDAAGRIVTQDGAYASPNQPSGTLYSPPQPQNLPAQTRTVWDGAGRKVSDTFWGNNTNRWATTYSYGGDRVTVTPPAGDTPTTTITDGRGQTSSLLQFHGASPTGAADTTTYTYTAGGKLQSMTDPGSHVWSWTYDVAGHVLTAHDPDSGTTTSTYDDASRLTSTTDEHNQLLSYTYDNDDRKTAQYAGTPTTGTRLASWTYDTKADGTALAHGVGRPSSSTRYVNGAAYTEQVTGYNALGEPTGSSFVLPAAAGTLAATYTTSQTYAPDGSVSSTTDPAEGGIAQETMNVGYDIYGRPQTLTNGTDYYGYSTTYNALNQVATTTAGTNTEVGTSRAYDPGTGRVTNSSFSEIDPSLTTATNDFYVYNAAGGLTSDTQLSDTAVADQQCYSYDGLRRLTQAFTATVAASEGATVKCGTAPTATNVGGPAPYWQNYTYDTVGDRASFVAHGTTATASTTTTTYSYPTGATAAHPHAVASTTTATTTAGGTTTTGTPATYGYDPDGNAIQRPNQTLTWDITGKLSSLQVGTTASKTQNNIYDADGNLLIRTDPTNGTVAYLGDTELHLAPGATKSTAVRTYNFLGSTVGERVSKTDGTNKITWLGGDEHNTQTAAIDDQTGAITHRYVDPFGKPRGTTAPWQDDHGFLNAPTSTFDGLTHLGARDYDSSTGQFISLDPVLDAGDPQQDLGYSYAHNDPTDAADPTGLRPEGDIGDVDAGQWGGNQSAAAVNQLNAREGGHLHALAAGRANDAKRRGRVSQLGSGTTAKDDPSNTYYFGLQIDPRAGPTQGVPGIGGLACFGTLACQMAYKHLMDNPGDVAGARDIAANYCFDNYDACAKNSYISNGIMNAIDSAETDFALGEGGLGADEGAGNDDPATLCANSFTGETPVVMADGSRKSIEDVKVGEKVLATDPQSGRTSAEPVVALIRHSGQHNMVLLRLTDGSVLHATGEHKVWDATLGMFVDADQLVAGHNIETISGDLVPVSTLLMYSADLTAYNLQIAVIHTYYAGSTPVLVHNSCADLDVFSRAGKTPDRNGFTEAGRSAQKHGNRPGGFGLPTTRTAAAYNEFGQEKLDDLLTAPNTAVRTYMNKSYGQVTEFMGPTYGARFDANGDLLGFL